MKRPSPLHSGRQARLFGFGSLLGQLRLAAFTSVFLGFTAASTATLLINQRALIRQHERRVEQSSAFLEVVIDQLAAASSPNVQHSSRQTLRQHSSYTLLFWIHLPDGELIGPENPSDPPFERLAQQTLRVHHIPPGGPAQQIRDQHRLVRHDERDFLTHLHLLGADGIGLWVAEDISANREFLATLLGWMLLVWAICLALTLLAISRLTHRFIQPLRDLNAMAGSITSSSLAISPLEVEKAPLELQELAHSYNSLLLRLARAWEHQRQLVGAVSHELQRRGAQLDPEQLRSLATAEAETERMARLLSDLLDLSRSESDQLGMALEPVAVDEVLRTACELARSQLARPLELRLSADPKSPPPLALAQADRLQQVVLNLIENTDKYSPAHRPVVVELASEPPGQLRISVIDQGIGIAEGDLPRIIERFHRGGNATAQRRGSGLGLSVVKLLVKAMGGRIEVESKLGQGSRFHIHLPAVAPPALVQ